MAVLDASLGVHRREALDEAHGRWFEPEIGHDEQFGPLGASKAQQLRLDDGANIGVARDVDHAAHISMGADDG